MQRIKCLVYGYFATPVTGAPSGKFYECSYNKSFLCREEDVDWLLRKSNYGKKMFELVEKNEDDGEPDKPTGDGEPDKPTGDGETDKPTGDGETDKPTGDGKPNKPTIPQQQSESTDKKSPTRRGNAKKESA